MRVDLGTSNCLHEAILAEKPALVILDLGLPDIDGLDLLRRNRHRQETLPIVVLSSRGDEAGKLAALDLGANDYITKPFGMDEPIARMRAAMRHQLQVHGERSGDAHRRGAANSQGRIAREGAAFT
jgi:DNA-binding response OmpR family regulator